MRKHLIPSVVLFCSTFSIAQTSSIVKTDLHNIHLTEEAGAYLAPGDGDETSNVVFITYSLPGGIKSVIQADLSHPLRSVQKALAKANNGHLSLDVTCADFGLLTVHGKTGKVTTMGTGHSCTVNGIH